MAGLFSQATLEQIRAASDIVDVIGSYLPLKRAGANFTALCPFHKEKSPSFNVNPSRQIFHCFGCHKGGDVFTFVKEYENIGFADAVRRLAERTKIPIEFDNRPGEQQSRHLKDQLLQIHEQITQRWQNCLANEAAGQLARDYLKKRGVSDEAIKFFRIGAAPEAWDDTVNWSKSKGHDLALVEKAGLVIRKEETGNHYDRFRGRLMFPICDEQGRVIGFSGRILSGDEKTAKYVNSPETAIFTKSKVFFGLDKSKRAILDAGFAIVCEGQLDLIACFMAGVQNIVAPQGTAFTSDHSRILKRYVDEVVLCFDSDNAGQNAAVRSLDHLLASGLAVRVAVVPAPHDPDSFIKENGGEAFQKLIEGAEGFFDYYLDRLCATNDIKTDKGRLTVLREMAEAVHKTGNRVLIDKYAQKTAARLSVSPESVRIEFKRLTSQTHTPLGETEEEETGSSRKGVLREYLRLIRIMFDREEYVDLIRQKISLEWFADSVVKRIIELRLEAHANGLWKDIATFTRQLNDDTDAIQLLTEVLVDDRPVHDPEKEISDIIAMLKTTNIEKEIQNLITRLSDPTLSEEQSEELLYQKMLLTKQAQGDRLKRGRFNNLPGL